ncbi:MAG: hypothetical protein ACOC2W_02590 [bacterium]
MKTIINTTHEEQYSDKSRVIGMLLNMSIDKNEHFKESFAYIYRDGMYVIFNTIVEMIEYLMYGDNKMLRAYITEDEFDKLYDSNIDGKLTDHLKWTSD